MPSATSCCSQSNHIRFYRLICIVRGCSKMTTIHYCYRPNPEFFSSSYRLSHAVRPNYRPKHSVSIYSTNCTELFFYSPLRIIVQMPLIKTIHITSQHITNTMTIYPSRICINQHFCGLQSILVWQSYFFKNTSNRI